VDVGNVVRSDKDYPLMTIQRLDPIYVDFTATEGDLPAVRANMEEGTLRVLATIPGGNGSPTTMPADLRGTREGTLTFLDNAVTNGTGTIKLRATIPNADHLFWPGQFVRVRLILKTLKDKPVIPADALQLSQQGTFVYVIGPGNIVQPRPVKVGQRQGTNGDLLAIESGLSAGEKVVVTGQLTLGPGAKVQVVPPATQPSAGEAARS
jgi:multidrug efflux system membrane fusion protein